MIKSFFYMVLRLAIIASIKRFNIISDRYRVKHKKYVKRIHKRREIYN